MQVISGSSNQTVKYAKALKLRKNREKYGEFKAEGERFVKEAVMSEWEISKIILSESFYKSGRYDFDIDPVIMTDKLFSEISDTENPQGIMAVVKIKEPDRELDDLKSAIILDRLQDPGNMGTVIRTADAFGIDGIILSEGCTDVYSGKVLRATMGSIFHIPIYREESTEEIISMLQKYGFTVYASHLKGTPVSKSGFYEAREERTAVIIGNEAEGIRETAARMADYLVKIPMPGKAESLNASVAAGILMYEMQRNKKI